MKNYFKYLAAMTALFLTLQIPASAIQENNLENPIEILTLDVVLFEDFEKGDTLAIETIKRALYEKGIVGIKSVPGYKEKALSFIQTAKFFGELPEEIKQQYAPQHEKGDTFLGYEIGKEKFQKPDGTWVVDTSKSSYYALVPNSPTNKWPVECDLQKPFEEISQLVLETGKSLLKSISLVENSTLSIDNVTGVCRMLHYIKESKETMENPLWCGAHFDHGLLTGLLPSYYFIGNETIPEPEEAGLFVRTGTESSFKKIVANDPDVMMFQVGEFGQLVTNDGIKATEHRVNKANGGIERYTLAVFFTPAMETIVHSQSILKNDTKYGQSPDGICSYKEWHEATFKRYHTKENL